MRCTAFLLGFCVALVRNVVERVTITKGNPLSAYLAKEYGNEDALIVSDTSRLASKLKASSAQIADGRDE